MPFESVLQYCFVNPVNLIFNFLLIILFSFSDKFTRFCQWKNVELNIHVSITLFFFLFLK